MVENNGLRLDHQMIEHGTKHSEPSLQVVGEQSNCCGALSFNNKYAAFQETSLFLIVAIYYMVFILFLFSFLLWILLLKT